MRAARASHRPSHAAAIALLPFVLACASVPKGGGHDLAADRASEADARVVERPVDQPSPAPNADPAGTNPELDAYQGRTCALGLSYAQQRWYDARVGRFLSEDPVGWEADRLSQPSRGHAFGYAAGNPLMWTDPQGLDVGQPDSTTRRAQEDMAYEAARNEWSKDEGNWLTGCAAGEADNWRHIDSAAFNARSKSTEWLAGYLKCHGRPVANAWHDSDVARNTRGFWKDSTAMACVLGGGNGFVPVGDVSDLPDEMQEAAAACEYGTSRATLVMTGGRLGLGLWRGLKNMHPMPRPALAGVTADGRTVAAGAEEVSAAERIPQNMEARARQVSAGQAVPEAKDARLSPYLRNKLKRIENASAAGGPRGVTGAVAEEEALALGERFVGPDYRVTNEGRVLVSADGLRQFRMPSVKRGINPLTGKPFSRTGVQVNFESRQVPEGRWTSNVHLDVRAP